MLNDSAFEKETGALEQSVLAWFNRQGRTTVGIIKQIRKLKRNYPALRANREVLRKLEEIGYLQDPLGSTAAEKCSAAADPDALLEKLGEFLPLVRFPSQNAHDLHLGVLSAYISAFHNLLTRRFRLSVEWSGDDGGKINPKLTMGLVKSLSKRYLIAHCRDAMDHTVKIRVSLYEDTDAGFMTADHRNVFARRLYSFADQRVFVGAGVVEFESLLRGPHEYTCGFPVDAVYTWVNDRDPYWNESYKRYREDYEKSGLDDTTDMSRFFNRDELKFSLRSVSRYLPWINHIYVFSNCSPPPWFDTGSSGVTWVDHESAIPAEYLPTFNSHVIESFLHRIPGLCEHFIYFNDDVFVNLPLSKDNFFLSNGLSLANLEPYGVVFGDAEPDEPDYLNAARNGAALIRERFGTSPTQLHQHAPFALRKSVLQSIEGEFSGALDRMRISRFRGMNDISVASFLYHHYAFAVGAGIFRSYGAKLIKSGKNRRYFERALAGLDEWSSTHTFCLNDGLGSHKDRDWDSLIKEFLVRRFPVPSEYEIASDLGLERPCRGAPVKTGTQKAEPYVV